MVKGLFLIIAIIVFAILTILCFIFAIIYFVNSKKGKFGWLGGFASSLTGLIVAVFLLVNGIVHKASSFARDMQESFRNSGKNVFDQIDTSEYKAYIIADSLNSKQIEYLTSLEPESHKGGVPHQFYHYLGFKDYYRLPLKYPFSLHCTDSLGNASLFNEMDVTTFDANANGEKDCEVYNISEFVFDKDLLIAKRKYNENDKEKTSYIIYHFNNDKFEEFESLNKAILKANNLKFSMPYKFCRCDEYFKSF